MMTMLIEACDALYAERRYFNALTKRMEDICYYSDFVDNEVLPTMYRELVSLIEEAELLGYDVRQSTLHLWRNGFMAHAAGSEVQS